MLKRIATVAAVIMMALAVTPGVSNAEPREPTCRGTGCDGVNPMSVDCYRDAISLEGTRIWRNQYSSIVIRYSPTCQSAWARLEGSHYYYNINIHSYWGDYSWRTGYTSYATPGVPFTPMVYTGRLWGSALLTETCDWQCTRFWSLA